MRSPFVFIEAGRQGTAPASEALPSVPAQPPAPAPAEIGDLRSLPIYGDRADLSAYDLSGDPGKTSTALPIGTQARFLAAADAAHGMGRSLNTLLTLRWASLTGEGDTQWLQEQPVPARIDTLVQRLRKWLGARKVSALYIWVRETIGVEDEHWHIALRLPKRHRADFAAYLAQLTGEPAQCSGQPARSEGEISRGHLGSWHLAADTRPERHGHYLAAYLGKGEPSQRMFRGKLINNTQKPLRGRSFGGTEPDGKYDADQGMISGTAHRTKRFLISKPLLKITPKDLR